MKRVKKAAVLALCLILLCPLWGCGGRELYERLLIHGIGVDVDESGYVVTVRSSVSPEDEGEEYFVCRGRSVLEALNSLTLSTGRKPFYTHNYLAVFGRKCAQQGLEKCLDFFVRYDNTRPTVQMYLAEDRAEDILGLQKDGKYLRMGELQQLGDSGRDNGKAVSVEVLDFVNGMLREGSSPVLPVLRAVEGRAEIVSTAYFDGDALKGFLTLEETRGYLAVKQGLSGGEALLEGEAFGEATLTLSQGEGEISLDGEKDRLPAFTLHAKARGDVGSRSGNPDREELEQALSDLLQGEVESALQKAVVEDGCDIFGFGNLLYQKDPARWRQLRDSWKNGMSRCAYRVRVTAEVSGAG